MPRSLDYLAVLAMLAPVTAQTLQPAGHLMRATAATYTRASLGMSAGELIQRFDADDLRGIGVELAHPGMHVIRGAVLGVIDYAQSTPNPQVDVTLYTEDPTRPGYPDVNAPLGGITGVVPTGLFQYTAVVFPTPVLAPDNRDLFLGVTIPATDTPFWGVRILVLPGTPGTAMFDRAGAAMPASPPEANSYVLTRDLTTGILTYEPRGQYLVDLLTTSPSGMPGTMTNQASWQVSIPPPGGTSMLSGFHPDAASPPQNHGRNDDVTFVYQDVDATQGSPVLFLGAIADFGPVLPLAQIVPGSVGSSCLDPSATFTLGIGTLNNQLYAHRVTIIYDSIRPSIRGISWTQQAIGLDPTTGTLRGSLCGRQHF